MKVAAPSRQVPAGMNPFGVAYNPGSETAHACMKSVEKRAAYLPPSSPYQDPVSRSTRPDTEHHPIVARRRHSTQKAPNGATDTPSPEPLRQARHRRSPLSSSVTAAPSREAPPPPTETQPESPKEIIPPRLSVRDVEVENLDQTNWHEYEIPSELEVLQPGMPEEIRNIVQESLDEQHAMRLSKLQAPAIVVRTTITTDEREPEDGGAVVAESSAMASNRYTESSPSSVRTESIDLSLNSTTSLGSSSAASGPLKPVITEERTHSRSSGEGQYADLNLTSRKLWKSREKLSRTHGLFRMLQRPKDVIPAIEIEQDPETYECTSCFDDIPSTDAIRVPCRHRYCAPCFSQLIATAIHNEDQFPPKCCLQEIPRGVLRNHLKGIELASFDNKALEYSVAIGSRYYCARPQCAKWIDTTEARSQDGSLKCPHCRNRMCTMCRGQAHGAEQDCPQDFGLDAALQQAEREGWRRCYNCRAMVELNTGCRHITCKCKAEFCYTCGARWKTCACTEEDQAQRARQIRENLRKLDAEARAEEEEIQAAIAAVEEAEGLAAAERAEEERKQEELRVEEARLMTLREVERWENINRHFRRLRDMLDKLRADQSDALGRRHEMQMEEMERNEKALEAATAQGNDADSERARIITSTHSKILELRKKHATELVQTRSRHRRDEDDCLLKIAEHDSLTDSNKDGEQQAPDAATILETLLSAQELERSTLRVMQAREMEKHKKRGTFYLRIFEDAAQREAERKQWADEQGRSQLIERIKKVKRRQWAEWKWVELVTGERMRMLGEDERRMVLSGGEVGDAESGELKVTGAF